MLTAPSTVHETCGRLDRLYDLSRLSTTSPSKRLVTWYLFISVAYKY